MEVQALATEQSAGGGRDGGSIAFRLRERAELGCLLGSLRIELPQVVVQVFVQDTAPGVWGERADEGMRMTGALRFAAVMELPDLLL